jgi:hypothetical protein
LIAIGYLLENVLRQKNKTMYSFFKKKFIFHSRLSVSYLLVSKMIFEIAKQIEIFTTLFKELTAIM